jgi:hypothetical protein
MSLSLAVRGLLATVMAVLAAVAATLTVGVLGSVSVADALGSCPNEQFRIGPGASLPDCRAYEMVSPPDKNGGEVDGGIDKGALVAPEQAAADGEAVTYASASAFIGTDTKSAVGSSQYLSTRGASGWSTREVVPTQQLPEGKLLLLGEGIPDFSLFQGFNEDLNSGFLLAWNPQPDPAAPAGYFNPYLYEAGNGGYELLSSVTPPTQPPGQATLAGPGFGAVYAGMSADGQHVIFEANDALTPEAIPGRVNLYEWSAGRPLELVSVLPEGTVDTSGAEDLNGDQISMSFGAPSINYEMPNDPQALSSDGRRAFWSGGTSTGGQVYMHEIVDSGARTVDLSASQKSGQPQGGGNYWAANAEGSLAYFTSTLQLTDNSTAATSGPDLYQYDTNTEELTDLSVDFNSGEAADVQGVLGIGESAGQTHVYFAAGGVLASNENSLGEKALPQTCRPQKVDLPVEPATPCNVYVYHEGQTTFIARLGGSEGEETDYSMYVKRRTSRVSPDGRLLAFQSSEPLSSYNNLPANGRQCPESVKYGDEHPYVSTIEGRCVEVYEYDAQTGVLACASCALSGLPPTADSLVPETQHSLGNVRGWESSTVQQRYLLDDGRLFFQSDGALLPEATDGRQNVYEYEPEGVGQCAASGAGNCMYLISTGESAGDSYFADASADGRDVFFVTNEQLVPQDGDGANDVYDAREGGGFSPATPPPCAGESCKPAVTPAPAIYGAPSSATFQGLGDVSTAPAVKPATKKKAKHKSTRKKSRRKQAPRKGSKRVRGGKAPKSSSSSERGRR